MVRFFFWLATRTEGLYKLFRSWRLAGAVPMERPAAQPSGGSVLNELAQFLIENLFIDFKGEVNTETLRAFLRQDDSAEARALLQKIIEENGIEELIDTLGECLSANLATGINPTVIREHLIIYSES